MIRRYLNSGSLQAVKRVARTQATYGGGGLPKSGASTPLKMEKCLNTVQLLGRVGNEPKIGGSSTKKVVQFSMATSIYYQSGNDEGYSSKGGMQSKTLWHNIAVFRPYLQDKVENLVRKGSRVLVNGSIDYSSYIDDNGMQKTSVSIIPDDIIIMATPIHEQRTE